MCHICVGKLINDMLVVMTNPTLPLQISYLPRLVFGWFQRELTAQEQGPEYVVQAGYIKGATETQKSFHLTINTELGSACKYFVLMD